MFKKLVQVKGGLKRELELEIANLKLKGTELVLLFQDYGLSRPGGGLRRISANLPNRVSLVQALTVSTANPLPFEKIKIEECVNQLHRVLRGKTGQPRPPVLRRRKDELELKESGFTPGNILRMTWDFCANMSRTFPAILDGSSCKLQCKCTWACRSTDGGGLAAPFYP